MSPRPAKLAPRIGPQVWGPAAVFIYTLSGITSLAFEVLWARMLSLQFGVSIFGVVITVAAFMMGLGAGSLVGARWAARIRAPLRLFAFMEAVVALYALVLPYVLGKTDLWLGGVVSSSGLGLWYTIQGISALVLMLLPALAMGCGFPLLLRVISGAPVSLGGIYGLNACGGALGALWPLYLLPVMGWAAAVQAVAALGLTVGASAWLLALVVPQQVPENAAVAGGVAPLERTEGQGWRLLLAYAGVGMASIMLEIGWTRLFGMLLLRTEYVLAVILAVFLIGIGCGSLLSRYLQGRRWFTLLPALAGGFGIASLWAVPLVARWVENAQFSTLWDALLWQGLALAVLTLPVTLVLGAWLPLLTERYGGHELRGAWWYGVNSIGAALGAGIAGFITTPWLGTPATVILASLLLFICGMSWVESRRPWMAGAGLIALAWPVYRFPPVHELMPLSLGGSRDIYRYEDAISLTHVIERRDGQRVLLTDMQRMDASSDATAVALQKDQARLPLLLHPGPRSVLFLGLGTGISAAGSLPFPHLTRTAVELSQGAIDAAARWFNPVNEDIMLKMSIVHDDARRFLRATREHYDVIIGDVFHPDLVGRSALLSVQQFQRARARLAPGGLFVQWLALNQFDVDSLRTVLRTFRRVYPHAMMFLDGFRLALVGPRDTFSGEKALLVSPGHLAEEALAQATGREGIWSWLGRYWGPVPDDGDQGVIEDEWRPRIEYELPRARYSGDLNLAGILAWLLERRPPLAGLSRTFHIAEEDLSLLERGYIATGLAVRGWLADLKGQTQDADRLIRYAYEANSRDRWVSCALADNMLSTLPRALQHGLDKGEAYRAVLRVCPAHVAALRAMWRLERSTGHEKRALAYLDRLRSASPLDRDVRGGVDSRAHAQEGLVDEKKPLP